MKFDGDSAEKIDSFKKLLENPISIQDLSNMLKRYGTDEDIEKDKDYKLKVCE